MEFEAKIEKVMGILCVWGGGGVEIYISLGVDVCCILGV